MKLLLGLGLLLGLQGSAVASQATFKGEFGQVSSSEGQCGEFFKQRQYTAKFFLTGFTGKTAVLYLESPTQNGGLHRVNQVGLYGANNDFMVERKYEVGNQTIHLVADGIVDYKFILFKQSVKVLSANNEILCSSEAEYSGFN